MMVASQLPNFEIPTGLMATGLRGLRGFGKGLRGMGQVNVGPLATAFFEGKITPSYLPTQYYNGPMGETEPASQEWYATQTFAQQVASLLGGSVINVAPTAGAMGLPEGNAPIVAGSNFPPAYTVQLPDGTVLPGALALDATGYDECAVETALLTVVPGGQLSAACAAGGTGLTLTQLAIQNSTLSPAQQIVAANDIVGGAANLPPASTPVNIPTVTVQPVAQPPVTPANPTGIAPTVPAASPAADPCTSIQASIAAWQASGISNATIYSAIQQQAPSLLTCASVQALTTSAGAPPAGSGTQPGDLQGSGGTNNTNNTTPPATDNTTLYVGIGIALLVGALILGGQK